jgi:hypothetical protein
VVAAETLELGVLALLRPWQRIAELTERDGPDPSADLGQGDAGLAQPRHLRPGRGAWFSRVERAVVNELL